MKRFGFILILPILIAIFFPHSACDKHPVSTPMPPPTATPNPIVNITLAGSAFNPASVTITAGTIVVWTNTDPFAHDLLRDNGFNVCQGGGQVMSTGTSVTILYNSAPLTINYQCVFHSTCGGPPCDATCGGMAGKIFVQ